MFPEVDNSLVPKVSPLEAECAVCGRTAICRNYGVLTCSACKMFFRRTLERKSIYICQNDGTCIEFLNLSSKCRACRFQKCLEVGMKDSSFLELKNDKEDELCKVLKELMKMDSKRISKLFGFYSEDDPALGEVLEDRSCMKRCDTFPTTPITLFDWSYLLNYLLITYFMDFEFISDLPTPDKLLLFRANILKLSIFCGSMRAYQKKVDRMKSPDGKEYHSKALTGLFKDSKKAMGLIASRTVTKLIELKVTNEEFILLNLIFFCDPEHRNSYASSLFQYCQIHHQSNAPTRFVELLSVCHIINQNTTDLQYLGLLLQASMPNIKFKKLVYDTYDLPGKSS